MSDETERAAEPPETCPRNDVLENPAPRGRFRIDRRLFLGIVVLLAAIAFGGMPDEVWVIAAADGAPALRTGAGLSSGDVVLPAGATAELQLGRRIRLRVHGPAQLRLPAGPGRWFGGGRTLAIEAGRVLGSTGRAPLGFPLEIAAGAARVGLRGGTFLIERGDGAAAVALQEGNMTLLGDGGLNAEQLIGRCVTIPDDPAAARETRGITDAERREFADLVARGLPPLEASRD